MYLWPYQQEEWFFGSWWQLICASDHNQSFRNRGGKGLVRRGSVSPGVENHDICVETTNMGAGECGQLDTGGSKQLMVHMWPIKAPLSIRPLASIHKALLSALSLNISYNIYSHIRLGPKKGHSFLCPLCARFLGLLNYTGRIPVPALSTTLWIMLLSSCLKEEIQQRFGHCDGPGLGPGSVRLAPACMPESLTRDNGDLCRSSWNIQFSAG